MASRSVDILKGMAKKEDRAWAQTTLKADGEKPLLVGWVDKINKNGSVQKRLLVVGQFRVLTGAKGMRRTVKRRGHWFDLEYIESTEPDHLTLDFGEFVIKFSASPDEFAVILDVVMSSYVECTRDLPTRARLNWRHGTAPSWPDPEKDPLTGYALAAKAHSIKEGIEFPLAILHDIRTDSFSQRFVFKASQFPRLNVRNKSQTVSLLPLAFALQHDRWFLTIDLTGLERPDLMMAVAKIVLSNSTAEELLLSDTSASKGFTEFGRALQGNPDCALQVIDLSGALLRDKGLEQISPGLASLPNLTSLSIANCEVRTKGIKKLFAALEESGRQTMTALDLSGNHLGSAGSHALSDWIQRINPPIASLKLEDCGLDFDALVGGLEAAIYLEVLNLSSNSISKKVGIRLSSSLSQLAYFRDLRLQNTGIDATTVKGLLSALLAAPVEEDFGLGILVNDVPLGTTGMSVVVSCFDDVAGDRLTALSANNCRLGPAGVGLLGTAVIASCPNLQKLFVSSNIASAEDDGDVTEAMMVLADCARLLPLVALEIRGDVNAKNNKMAIGAPLARLLEGCCESQTLMELDISENGGGLDVAVGLTQLLSVSRTLQTLAINNNNLDYQGFTAILNAVSVNDSLTTFRWPQGDLSIIMKAIKKQKKSRQADLKEDLVVLRNKALAKIKSNKAGGGPKSFVLREAQGGGGNVGSRYEGAISDDDDDLDVDVFADSDDAGDEATGAGRASGSDGRRGPPGRSAPPRPGGSSDPPAYADDDDDDLDLFSGDGGIFSDDGIFSGEVVDSAESSDDGLPAGNTRPAPAVPTRVASPISPRGSPPPISPRASYNAPSEPSPPKRRGKKVRAASVGRESEPPPSAFQTTDTTAAPRRPPPLRKAPASPRGKVAPSKMSPREQQRSSAGSAPRAEAKTERATMFLSKLKGTPPREDKNRISAGGALGSDPATAAALQSGTSPEAPPPVPNTPPPAFSTSGGGGAIPPPPTTEPPPLTRAKTLSKPNRKGRPKIVRQFSAENTQQAKAPPPIPANGGFSGGGASKNTGSKLRRVKTVGSRPKPPRPSVIPGEEPMFTTTRPAAKKRRAKVSKTKPKPRRDNRVV